MRTPVLTIAALAVLALTSAAVPAQTMRDQMWGGYDPGDTNGARGGRQLPTVVTGNPFSVPDADFVRTITEAMSPSAAVVSRDQEAAAKAPLRVLMLFNASTYTGDRLCDRSKPLAVAPPSPAGSGSGGGRMDLVATFCRGDSPMTQVITSLNIAGPNDPHLKNMMQQVTANLFPPRNPDRNGDLYDQ